VLVRLGRRILFLGGGFFAILGFIAVPVGEQTGLEHVRGFFRSDTGKRVVSVGGDVGVATRGQLLRWLGGAPLPEPSSSAGPVASGEPPGDARAPVKKPSETKSEKTASVARAKVKRSHPAESDRNLNGKDIGRIIRIVEGIPNQRESNQKTR
jgi:hypothetical protein